MSNSENTNQYFELNQLSQEEKEKLIERIPVVTTDGIDGYIVASYKKVLSTTRNISLEDFVRKNAIEKAKKEVIRELKEIALEEKCNAVIGLKMDYYSMTVRGYVEYFVTAIATGVRMTLSQK